MSLEEAADRVGVSKKSLDDYLSQLRQGRALGFDFNEHKDQKVGFLRQYVKDKQSKQSKMGVKSEPELVKGMSKQSVGSKRGRK